MVCTCIARPRVASGVDFPRSLSAARSTRSSAAVRSVRTAARRSIFGDPVRCIRVSRSASQDPRLFLKPVQFHLQLSDLLIQLRFFLLDALVAVNAASSENLRSFRHQLPFPSCDLIWMNPVDGPKFLYRPLSFDCLQSNLCLEAGCVLFPLSHVF